MLLPSGNPFECHEEVLYLRPLIPPQRFDISPPCAGTNAQKVYAHSDFSLKQLFLNSVLFVAVWYSAAGDGLTNIVEKHTFVPRAHYLRLLRRRRRHEPQYHSVLRLCSEFRDSRSFLCLNIKKSIHGKSPCMNKMRRDQAGTSLSRVYTRISRLRRHKPVGKARRSMRRRCKHV